MTGATGFIGRYLIAGLLDEEYTVYALTRKSNCGLDKRVRLVNGDIITDVDVPANITTIFHCAGIISQEDQMEKVNVSGTQRVVEAALKQNCRLVHLSSAGVVGNFSNNYIDETTECHPLNLYERTKHAAEKIVIKGISEGLKAQILRPTIVFGIGRDPNKDSFLHLVRAIKSGHYKNIGASKSIYNIISVNEVVRAMLALDDVNIQNGGTYFINSPLSFTEFSTLVKTATTGNGRVGKIPYSVALIAATLFSVLSAITGKKMPLTYSRLKALTDKRIFSQERLIKTTAYQPLREVEDYIIQVCKEYTERGLLG